MEPDDEILPTYSLTLVLCSVKIKCTADILMNILILGNVLKDRALSWLRKRRLCDTGNRYHQ